jgi:very-short-patch-repair endonuclease
MHPMILNRARQLRRDATPPERLLWSVLRGRRLGGLKFRRQESIGPYVVDFCCREVGLIVEVDGSSHEDRQEPDTQRARWFEGQGFRLVRVANQDVVNDLEAVARCIAWEAGIDRGE